MHLLSAIQNANNAFRMVFKSLISYHLKTEDQKEWLNSPNINQTFLFQWL